ncbi:serine hydrolase domain-containing protein [Catenovulum sp. SX2]|uniref:serine hydrolase domain-containing protein n=1 Tax=Catenovulum sp. SX2 TaxID=3398614 RepID=UPI003F834E89
MYLITKSTGKISKAKYLLLVPLMLAIVLVYLLKQDMQVLAGLERWQQNFPHLYQKTNGLNGQQSYQELHALLIYRNEQLLYEQYYKGNQDYINFEQGIKRVKSSRIKQWQYDDLHYIASVNKSLTAIFIGILLEEFSLSADSLISQHYQFSPQQLATCPVLQQLTFAHLLSMQSPWQWDEWQGDDLINLWQQTDFNQYLLSKPCKSTLSWQYNSAIPNFLLNLFDNKLRQQQQISIQTYLDKEFFQPLKIKNYLWVQQPNGVVEGSARMHMQARDLAKIGQLILNQGKYAGQQIVSANWLKHMTQPQQATEAGDYGYFIWLREYAGEPAWVMEGDGGQYLIILPELAAVVVIFQGNYLDWPLYHAQSKELLSQYVVPQLRADK